MNVLTLLAPDLTLIVFGVVLRRFADFGDAFWAGLEKLIYFFLFPALLFVSILKTPIMLGQAVPMLASAMAAMLTGITLGYLAGPVLRPTPVQYASGIQCAFRFNSYVALALSQRLGGDAGIAACALIVAFAVPTANVAAVFPLARHGGTGLARELVRNPLILGTLGGLLANLTGLHPPAVVVDTLSRLGSASLALGLVAVGAGLRLGRPGPADTRATSSGRALTIWITLVKLVAMPAVALLLARELQLPPATRQIVVMFAAMPTASSAYILAVRMGGDGAFVAFLITVSTLAALVALPLWLSLAG